jgi:CheY-like chemotaxis protein
MANILIIDDEEQIRCLLSKMLMRDGHKVYVANDGIEALNVFMNSN